METHEGQPESGEHLMRLSGNTSMIITAFGFMVLMLVVTAPASGPAPVMDHGPGPVPNNVTPLVAGPPPFQTTAGSGPVIVRIQAISRL
jgi:hypothetical protein